MGVGLREARSSASQASPGESSQDISVLQQIEATLRRYKTFACDVETTGLDPLTVRLRGVALAAGDNAWYVSVLGSRALPYDDVVAFLKRILLWPDKTVVFHGGKFDLQILKVAGVEVSCKLADTLIAAYSVDETRARGGRLKLKGKGGVVDEEFGVTLPEYKQTELGGMLPGFGRPEDEYAMDDARYTLRLWEERFKPRLKRDPRLWKWFQSVEMEIVRVIADMELTGFAVDLDFLRNAEREISGEMEEIASEIFNRVGHPFNLSSADQVANVFYGELGLQPGDDAKAEKSDRYSVGKGVLSHFVGLGTKESEVVEKYLDWKRRSTMLRTFVRGIYKRASRSFDGRVHSGFLQAGTTTGRLASRDPNLENIPRPFGFDWEYSYPIRKAFVAASGRVLLCLDYSQLELRLIAIRSGDPVMLHVYETGGDIHAATMEALGIEVRSIAKSANFALIYGQTARSLQRYLWEKARLRVSLEDCTSWRNRFFRRYKGLPVYHDQIRGELQETGVVYSIVGRPRRLKHLASIDFEKAWRVGVNASIQMSAADVVKLGMRDIAREINSNVKWQRYGLVCVDQIHDELVYECREDGAPEAFEMIKHKMEHALKLPIPLEVEGAIGRNWYDAKS